MAYIQQYSYSGLPGEDAVLKHQRYMTEIYIDEPTGAHSAFDVSALKYENPNSVNTPQINWIIGIFMIYEFGEAKEYEAVFWFDMDLNIKHGTVVK